MLTAVFSLGTTVRSDSLVCLVSGVAVWVCDVLAIQMAEKQTRLSGLGRPGIEHY